MNTMLEAPPSPDRSAQLPQQLSLPVPVQLHVASQASATRHVSHSSAADRLVLRLGLALVLWGRRHDRLPHNRAAERQRAVDRYRAEQDRVNREVAAHRLLLLDAPRR